ncbi:serine hydrolase [Rubrivirga sp. IMCC43871]|uniref:serine hydrolase n=1 Tax=Rubrivirga sp. IMCC43871 TaxID=3391575 RepID=UPI00398FDD03
MLRLALLALLILLAAPARAQVAADVEALVEAYHEADLFNGSVLVSDGGEVVWSGGVGLANAEWAVPNAADTRFRVGSVTKQFTAALILQLMEAGAIDLHAPVSTYVPEVPVDARITTHHLLAHTSGLHSYTALPDFGTFQRDPHTPAELMALTAGMPLDFEPGESWSYSNSGYILLGMIVEAVTGETYADALQSRLLDPLGMTASTYDDGVTVYARAASGYSRGTLGLRQTSYLDTSVPYAAGMLLASVEDLKTWSDALFAGDVFESAETLALMNTRHAEIPGLDQDGGYGYGVFVGNLEVGGRMVPIVQHGGGINGFTTGFWRLVDRDAVIAASSNTQDGSDEMIQGLIAILYGDEPEVPRPSALGLLREALAEGGAEAVETAFDAARAGDEVTVTERDLNTLGYLALADGDTDTAVALFRLNVAAYPEAWNPHDSLGEGLLAAGDTTGAIASYRRAHEISPAAPSPRAALEALGVDLDTVTLSDAILNRYVGSYQIQPGFALTVRLEDGQLITQATGQSAFPMTPISETEFAPPFDARLVFEAGDPAPAVTLFQGGNEIRAARVEE